MRAAVVGAAVVGLLVGCSNGESQDTASEDSPSSAAAPAEPTSDASAPDGGSASAAPSSDADDSGGATQDSTDGDDSGEQNPDGAFVEDPGAYDDEPAPPASEAMVLCNLSQAHLIGLADIAAGEDGGSISLAVVALDDNIQVWRPLVGFYPEMTEDLDRAEQVLDLWHDVMDAQADGDEASADEALESAQAEIDQIVGPSDELSEALSCES